MASGDPVLTPLICCNGHINASYARTVWFDAANIPLAGNLDANFFEPGSRLDADFWKVDEGGVRL